VTITNNTDIELAVPKTMYASGYQQGDAAKEVSDYQPALKPQRS
jgi:hypothetical protein